MRCPVFYIILLVLPVISTGQVIFPDDTIKIKEVIVKGSLLANKSGGYKQTVLDTSMLVDYSLNNLSEIITETTSLFIKSYGTGGIATTSFRGTGASHTKLTWNEININSPMVGQADLSLIPAGFIDELKIYYGGGSISVGDGGLGGIINIETKPDWKTESDIRASFGAGSFDRYSSLVKIRSGGKRFQSSTKAFFLSARNDFRFLNSVTYSEPVFERRKNAELFQKGLIQEFYFKGEKSIASARLWYQSSDRNLPPTMLMSQTENKEQQVDEFLRAMIGYERHNRNVNYKISLALFSDRLDYLNELASIDSRNHSNTLISKGVVEIINGNRLKMNITLNNELNIVNSVNYSELKARNVSTLTVSARRLYGEKLGINILMRELMDDRKFLFPDFTAGMDFRMINNKESYLKLNFTRNSKVPSLNDLYWNPGGNPELRNEYSYSGEISWDIKSEINKALMLESEISIYSNRIRDMIQWRPGEHSYWSPVNINSVNTTGIESGLNLNYKINRLSVRLTGVYAFTSAHVINSGDDNNINGKQLIYVPENLFNSCIKINFRSFYYSWTVSFTGKRYTIADNTHYLPGFTLNNSIIGIKIKSGKNSFDLNLKADNIFGTTYQTIAYHPMPGRSFLFTITYHRIK
jgi:vitamin B12 transporter